jgi:hypothetical protein
MAAQGFRVSELAERELSCSVGVFAFCDQLTPAVVEMLRELFDDLGFACGRQPDRRQARTYFRRPVTSRLLSR